MLAQEVARKYSHALFLAIKDKGMINEAHEQAKDLLNLIENDNSLTKFLNAPQVLDEYKRALIRDVFGEQVHRFFVELLILIVQKHRVAYLTEIIDDFIRLVEAEKGIARVTVITARQLVENQRTALMDKLVVKTKLTVQLEEKIDAKIIGGMIVTLHNEIIDGSIRHGLNTIEEQLVKVRVV